MGFTEEEEDEFLLDVRFFYFKWRVGVAPNMA